jgi:hypothetical protein
MKHIVTLALSFLIIGAAAAQTQAEREEARRIILGQQKKGSTPGSKESRDVILGGDNRRIHEEQYPGTYPNGSSSRAAEIERVNREYDSKIQSIRYNNSLSAAEKEKIIRQLESDRRKRINAINKYYNEDGKRNKKYDDDDDNNGHRNHKGNNGKHLGWEKGKGNQMKRRG